MTKATQTAQAANQLATQFAFRNRIINGDIRIDQRNAGAAVTPVTGYTVDRFVLGASQASKLTFQQVVDAPAGFKNSLKMSVASAYTPLAADYFSIGQRIEGHNLADLQFGMATAQPVTLQFWVKSSLTGTFSCAIGNGIIFTRSYVFTYSIPVANQWTKVTLTIAGDVLGSWATDNSVGMYILWDLGYGSNAQAASLNSWLAGNSYKAASSVSFVANAGATWQITGIQLEAGKVATPFENRPIGLELAQCQRYFEFIPASVYARVTATSYQWTVNVTYKVVKRANPSCVLTGNSATGVVYFDGAINANLPATVASGTTNAMVQTNGQPTVVGVAGSFSLAADAEL